MKFESWKVIFIKKLKSVLNVSGTLTLFAGIHLVIRNMQCLLSLLSHEVTSDSATPWTAVHQAPWGLLRLMSFESVMLSNRLILCHPLLLLPSIFPSTRVFSYKLVPHSRLPKYYWSEVFSGVSGPEWHRETLSSAQACCGPPNTSDLPTTSKGCCISEGSAGFSSCHCHSPFASEGSGVTGSFAHQLGIPANVSPDSEHTTPCDLGPRLGVEAGL